jgi:CRISPR/Cas system CSM-associated protein Csm3 (group 7 of RAMP superfamily)
MPSISVIDYELHLAADLHIGSGVGLPGVIDEAVVRDHKKFAYAPFSEIKGIVRDSCVRLLKYLDCHTKAEYLCKGQMDFLEQKQTTAPSAKDFCQFTANKLCALCTIFGSPITPARWWFSPAQYSTSYKMEVERVDKLANILGTDKSSPTLRDSAMSAHAAINPQTRRASEGQLFNLEVVRLPDTNDVVKQQAIWNGQILYRAASSYEKSSALGEGDLLGVLTAALLFTRRIGGRRRRGWGSCRFVLSGTNKADIETQLREWITTVESSGTNPEEGK